ncbi:hypothetical protein L1987_13362 [Smallanthus sonchifolius]|uniref:Uncharacterized protein n=1 Tax=Smallanthus sonchifolius TaxID=185202 RepID=A0ACB9JJT5_9ASTR|nr:hypothetical protein L1987_13362 [Smallanthus sonchifolius]
MNGDLYFDETEIKEMIGREKLGFWNFFWAPLVDGSAVEQEVLVVSSSSLEALESLKRIEVKKETCVKSL